MAVNRNVYAEPTRVRELGFIDSWNSVVLEPEKVSETGVELTLLSMVG
jgi:hypothetical protein